jgi:hypothetical protein
VIVWLQKASSRAVCGSAMPTRDLNHWRRAVTRDSSAIGQSVTWLASQVRRSNTASASLSSIFQAGSIPLSLHCCAVLTAMPSSLAASRVVRIGASPSSGQDTGMVLIPFKQ